MDAFRKRSGIPVVLDCRHDKIEDLRGGVILARVQDNSAGTPSPGSDLGTVVPLALGCNWFVRGQATSVDITSVDRPAPGQGNSPEHPRSLAFFLASSLLLHGVILSIFNREVEPPASIGIASVSVEIVLGAQSNAGHSPSPSESEVASLRFPEAEKPTDIEFELSHSDIKVPKPKAQDAMPIATPPEATKTELASTQKAVEKPMLVSDHKNQDAKETKKVRESARHVNKDGESVRNRSAQASASSPSSNGVGYGRSALDINYRGIVAAHLARYKQYPVDARSHGNQGTVTVTFSFNGIGNVMSVRLVRGSGVSSIDQEAISMVQRASPFPPPPSSQTMTFTVPLIFNLR